MIFENMWWFAESFLYNVDFFISWSVFFALATLILIKTKIVHKNILLEEGPLKDLLSLFLTFLIADIIAFFLNYTVAVYLVIPPLAYLNGVVGTYLFTVYLTELIFAVALLFFIFRFINIIRGKKLYQDKVKV